MSHSVTYLSELYVTQSEMRSQFRKTKSKRTIFLYEIHKLCGIGCPGRDFVLYSLVLCNSYVGVLVLVFVSAF
jgi:hypothetical protein